MDEVGLAALEQKLCRQWRIHRISVWGINATKFYPVIAYDMSKKNVVMKVQHICVVCNNCTVAHLQPQLTFTKLATFCIS